MQFEIKIQRLVQTIVLIFATTLVGFAQHQGHQMPKPSATPKPASSPAPSPTQAMPASSPAPSPTQAMPATEEMHEMDMGPLLMMRGEDIGIRIGSSDTNMISMGAIGSGTSWQPASSPTYMLHKAAGDWLLMLHYNLTAGINRQGGP